jgi:enoyl-CoA hydratase/carnithine racemase
MANLEYTVKDRIGTILLNRPGAKNAFTLEMIDEWAQALRSARTDLRTALDLISSHMAVVRSTQDSAEAMAAFREHRAPVFHGR